MARMRRRAQRDFTIIFGIVAVLGVLAGANYVFGLGDKVAQFTAMRVTLEEQRRAEGIQLLNWKLVQETGGSRFTGPDYHEELVALDGAYVNLIGFMTPLDRFRNVSEFLFLPLPLECYFCNVPPMRDVFVVQMAEGETTNLYEEPVLVQGRLDLSAWDSHKFFYALRDATLTAAESGTVLPRFGTKKIDEEHMAPQHGQEPELVEGMEPPTGEL